MEIDALPHLDLVLLSHLHEDHGDRVAEARLARGLPVVTNPAAAESLHGRGFAATQPLATWQTLDCAEGVARLMPGRHGPPLISRLLPPIMGSLLEFETVDGRRLLRLYVTGDTLGYGRIAEIRTRYADIDLALLHLGGTRVLGVPATMDGRQGVKMLRTVEPRRALPIHYDEYTVFKSPLAGFLAAATRAGLRDRVHALARGETFRFQTPEGRLDRSA